MDRHDNPRHRPPQIVDDGEDCCVGPFSSSFVRPVVSRTTLSLLGSSSGQQDDALVQWSAGRRRGVEQSPRSLVPPVQALIQR